MIVPTIFNTENKSVLVLWLWCQRFLILKINQSRFLKDEWRLSCADIKNHYL